ncbi:MAG: hypothetical protein IKI19_08005, partial [Prevotella sp.]|nr:hypothetical protein [Prevotella sp.]
MAAMQPTADLQPRWLTLGQIVRLAQLPRHQVVALLARFIRYGLAAWQLNGQQFVFALCQ